VDQGCGGAPTTDAPRAPRTVYLYYFVRMV
jgi:hypothetical protein